MSSRLAFADLSGTVGLIDLATGESVVSTQLQATGARFDHPAGLSVRGSRIVVTSSMDGRVHVLSSSTLETVRVIRAPGNRHRHANGVAVHPAGRLAAVAYRDLRAEEGLVVLWDLDTGEQVKRFLLFRAVADAVAFSPDGSRLAAVGASTEVAILGEVY